MEKETFRPRGNISGPIFFVDPQKAKRGRHLCDRARRRGFGIHGLTSQPLAPLKGDALSKT